MAHYTPLESDGGTLTPASRLAATVERVLADGPDGYVIVSKEPDGDPVHIDADAVHLEHRDNEFTVFYRDQPLAMVVIGGIPDGDDGYWSTAHPTAGGQLYEALGADEFLVGAWPDDDFVRLYKDKLTGEGA
jgi:hypothetical protein